MLIEAPLISSDMSTMTLGTTTSTPSRAAIRSAAESATGLPNPIVAPFALAVTLPA